MILSLGPDAWSKLIEALDVVEDHYRAIEMKDTADDVAGLVKALRELGNQTLCGRLDGYRVPDALGDGMHDILIQVVPRKKSHEA